MRLELVVFIRFLQLKRLCRHPGLPIRGHLGNAKLTAAATAIGPRAAARTAQWIIDRARACHLLAVSTAGGLVYGISRFVGRSGWQSQPGYRGALCPEQAATRVPVGMIRIQRAPPDTDSESGGCPRPDYRYRTGRQPRDGDPIPSAATPVARLREQRRPKTVTGERGTACPAAWRQEGVPW